MAKIKASGNDIAAIEEFTGPISPEQLRFVDSFVSSSMAIFMPVAGPCMLAVSSMHTHLEPLFVVNFSDSTSVVLEQGKYRAKANTVSYIPPNMPHHEVNEVEIPRYVAIMIRKDFLMEQAAVYTGHQVDLAKWHVFPSSDELISVAKRFISESKTNSPGAELVLHALSIETSHLLLRLMLGLKASGCLQVSRIEISRCIEFMRQNLSEKLTLSSLACFSGMSVSNFTRVFRQETGLSPIDYLIEMRLEVARRMLLSEAIPIKQIAMDCGFSNSAHFSSSFQKKYKQAPSEYAHFLQSK